MSAFDALYLYTSHCTARRITLLLRRENLPAADKMPPSKESNQRLRRGKTDQDLGHKFTTRPFCGWPIFNVPRRRRVYRSDGDFGLLERLDDRWERFTDLAGEREAKDRVNDVIGFSESLW